MTLDAADLKDLTAALSDRLYLQVAGWHLYLGDGTTPFRLSMAGIGLNVIFDWALVGGPSPWGPQFPINLGAPGLVLATVLINLLTCLALLLALQKRLGGLPLREWGMDSLKLTLAAAASGFAAWALSEIVSWPLDLIGRALQVGISGALGLLLFVFSAQALSVPEVSEITAGIARRFRRR